MVWCVRAFVAIVAISLSVVVGVWAQTQIGSEWPMIYAAGGITTFAAVFMVCGHEAWHRSAYVWSITMMVLALFLSLTSITIQLGGVPTVKDAIRTDREKKEDDAERERNNRKDVTDRISALEAIVFQDGTTIGAATPEMVQPQIDALKANPIYKRTNGCAAKEVTLDDSTAHCGQLGLAEQRLATAKELMTLRAERAGWTTRISKTAIAADPLSQNIAQIAKDLGWNIPMQSAVAWPQAVIVIALEVIAVFGPLAAFAFGRARGEKPTRARRQSVHSQDHDQPLMTIMVPPEEPKIASVHEPVPAITHAHESGPDLSQDSPVSEAKSGAMIPLETKANHGQESIDAHAHEWQLEPEISEPQISASHAPDEAMNHGATLAMSEEPIMAEHRELTAENMTLFQVWLSTCIDGDLDGRLGERVNYKDAYASYQKLSKARKRMPMSKPAFRLAIVKAGWVEVEKISDDLSIMPRRFKGNRGGQYCFTEWASASGLH
jgi:hypothetical protein